MYFILFGVVVGAMVAIQSSINSRLGQLSGEPFFAALVNFSGGIFVLSLLFVFGVARIPSMGAVSSVPWYYFLGGVLGATFVSAIIVLVPKMGVTLLLASVVLGQLLFAGMIDHWGFLGVAKSTFTLQKAIGIILITLGVYIVR